jgi:hypothetical protein
VAAALFPPAASPLKAGQVRVAATLDLFEKGLSE